LSKNVNEGKSIYEVLKMIKLAAANFISIHPIGDSRFKSFWSGSPPKGERVASHDPPLALSRSKGSRRG
jgi:hypothetical protein